MQLAASLVDKSLVRRADNYDATSRLVLLETIREYGLDQLQVHGEVAAARNVHLQWCLQLAEPLQPDRTDPVEVALLEQEQDNFRAALRWCIETDQATLGMRLGERMWLFWYMRGRWAEGRAWLSELLALPAARAFVRTGGRSRGGWSACALTRTITTQPKLCWWRPSDLRSKSATNTPGHSACTTAPAPPAFGASRRPPLHCSNKASTLSQRLDDGWSVAMTLQSMASVTFELGDVERAEELANVALTLFREQGHLWGVGRSLALLGRTAQHRADHQVARRFHYRSPVDPASAGRPPGNDVVNARSFAHRAGARRRCGSPPVVGGKPDAGAGAG